MALRTGAALTGAVGLGVGYGFWEASQIRVERQTIAVPNLAGAFAGKTIAVLADLHHGPFVSIDFIHRAVQIANSLKPDLFALVGDFNHRRERTTHDLPPCVEALSELRAPLGAYAVPGNHDLPDQGQIYQNAIASTALIDLTNRHECISLNGEHLWLAGVDDLWRGRPNVTSALTGVPAGAAVVLLSHNPDYAEVVPDPRVGLMLSGHTHGGQVYLPIYGSPWVPSQFGDKYRQGLVQGPASQVFVSRGLGEAGVPLRVRVPPEINLLTLVRSQRSEVRGQRSEVRAEVRSQPLISDL
jgi:uncharacterized protein